MSNFADTNLATNDPNNDNERVESILDQITVTPNALCMNCGGTGTSRVLPTTIPYFREVAVCFFKCDDCGFKMVAAPSRARRRSAIIAALPSHFAPHLCSAVILCRSQ